MLENVNDCSPAIDIMSGPLSTPMTRLFKVQHPIMLAGMSIASEFGVVSLPILLAKLDFR